MGPGSPPPGATAVSNFRLTLEYDGTALRGWQVQREGQRTVQGELERAIESVTGQRVRVEGAGRTDAGVHAEGQVASVALATRLAVDELQRALNARLPADVAVIGAEPAPDEFHARFAARAKLYRYRVWNHPVRSPLRARRALAWPGRIDLAPMAQAARLLVGRHDFASFQAAGSGVEDTVRELLRLDLESQPSGELDFWVEGGGFLRHMVRNLVGTLLEVGSGRRVPDSMTTLLAARDRRLAGPTAAAAGLTLVAVRY